MSRGARIIVGVVFALASVGFVLTGVFEGSTLPLGPMPFYVLAAFCAVAAAAALVPQCRPIAVRLIGASILGAFIAYAYHSRGTDDFARAIAGLLVFGGPGAYVAVFGRYPSWGRAAGAFNDPELDQDEGPEA